MSTQAAGALRFDFTITPHSCERKGAHAMPHPWVFAIANQKGGVGKTTTSINLAACLASLGRKTLVIDLDPQSNTTTGLGIDAHRVGNSIYELLVNDNITVNDVLRADIRPNLSLIPAKVDLYAADIERPDWKRVQAKSF